MITLRPWETDYNNQVIALAKQAWAIKKIFVFGCKFSNLTITLKSVQIKIEQNKIL